MSEKQKASKIDQSWKKVYKTGGLSLFIGGAILVVFLLLVFTLRIALPLTPVAVLEKPVPPVPLYLLAAIGESLLLPAALGIYLALKDVNKNQMLIASTLWLMSVAMFLVSRGQIMSLYLLSSKYIAANSEVIKTAYLVSADSVIEVANMFGNMALVFFQSGSIIIGSVVKGAFSKRTGNLVMVSAAMTIIGTLGVLLKPLALFTLLGLISTAVWQMLLGRRLYRLGGQDAHIEG
jgi:hypothetical protein